MSQFIRKLFVTLNFALLAHASTAAQPYPNRVIKVVVPNTAGSPVDAVARVLGQSLQGRLGQSLVIENRPGAGTTIGTKDVMAAAADGYTLLFTGPPLTYFRVFYPDFRFDPVKDLAAVATAVTWSFVLVVSPRVPVNSMSDRIAYAKANPGKLVFGFGLGTPPHILGEVLKRVSGVDITFVPYRGGEEARADLLGGRVDINMAPIGNMLPLIEDHKVKPLAVTSLSRMAQLPDVPTMAESGLPQVGFHPDAWLGFFAPARIPADVVNTFNGAVNATLNTAEMKETLATLGYEPKAMSPQQFGAFVVEETKSWPPRLRAAGLKAE